MEDTKATSNRLRFKKTILSAADTRALRAVQRKREQKDNRYGHLSRNRFLVSPQQTKCTVPFTKFGTNTDPPGMKTETCAIKKKPYSKEELAELRKLRYENMLKWKEEKKKLLDVEKQCRKPTFKTGLYKPEAPKFLHSMDDEESCDVKTPWKSASKYSVLKNRVTPAAQLKFPTKSNIVKPLIFHTGVTPLQKNSTTLLKGKRVHQGVRVSRTFRPPPKDLGVAPLPATPVDQSLLKRIKRNVQSFADKDFQFKAPAGLASYDLSVETDNCNRISMNRGCSATDESAIIQGENKTSSFHEQNLYIPTGSSSENDKHQTENEKTVTHTPNEATVSEILNHPVPDNNVSSSSEPKEEQLDSVAGDSSRKMTPLTDCSQHKQMKDDEQKSSASGKSEPDLVLSDIERSNDAQTFNNKLLVACAGHTPAAKTQRRTTRFFLRQSVGTYTPPEVKLRPRTPCSRVTRSSRSAHCDHFSLDSLITPKSASQKKSRHSRKRSVRILTPEIRINSGQDMFETLTAESTCDATQKMGKDNLEIINEALSVSSSHEDNANNISKSPFKTPVSQNVKKVVGRHSRISDLLDTSPWINRSRGSTSSRGKKKHQHFSNDLEAMFNDIPLEGLSSKHDEELGASPYLNISAKDVNNFAHETPTITRDDANVSCKENMTPTSELIKFLEPSLALHGGDGTPVWGAESAENTPIIEPQTSDVGISENIENFEVVQRQVKEERAPLAEISHVSLSLNQNRGRRRSKRISVSFQDISDDKPGVKFPVTPLKQNSSRISLGLFGKDCEIDNSKSCNEVIEPGEDLIKWDSPVVSAIEMKRLSHAHGKLRISLLSSLETCTEREEDLADEHFEGELSSLDTPTTASKKRRTRNNRISTAALTPARRSNRLSHIDATE